SRGLALDEHVEPGADRAPAVERHQGLLLRGKHELEVVRYDLAQQRRAVAEVEIELALAHAGTLDHVVEARPRDTTLVDQAGCGADDPLARRAPSRRPRHCPH